MNRTVALGCLALFLWAIECRADAPAAQSPPLLGIDVDLTQVVGDGTNRYLFVYVTIENQSLATLKLSSASFKLQVGDLVQRHAVPEAGQRSISVVVAAGVSDEEPAAELPGRFGAAGGGWSAPGSAKGSGRRIARSRPPHAFREGRRERGCRAALV